MTVFDDRRHAGRLLAERLVGEPLLAGADRVVVLAIPRGGLPVAAEVARALHAALDVVIVGKLRSPHNPEIGFGAVAEDGTVDIDDEAVTELGISAAEVEAEVADRSAAARARAQTYRGVADPLDLSGAVVCVVDDGIASGSSAREACRVVRAAGARAVVLAVPVAPASALADRDGVADAVVVLDEPAEFLAVDQAYKDFMPLDDTQAVATLANARVG